MGERGLSCSAMKIGLVTRSVQPPCIGLEQINERNPSISASLVIKKKKKNWNRSINSVLGSSIRKPL